MEFNENKVIDLLKELNLEENINPKDIPSLDLYMDQVITLFENGLASSKRNADEKILTKTMINNYSKANLFMPIKNKKYSRNHIILMILIYKLKQTLTIGDIKSLLDEMVDNLQKEGNIDLVDIYSIFLNINDTQVKEAEKALENTLIDIDEHAKAKSDYEKLLLIVLSLVNSANIQKRLAEKLIDTYLKKE